MSGNIDTQLTQVEPLLADIQAEIAIHGYSEQLFNREVDVQVFFINDQLQKRHELLWQQSRIKWLQDGDKNSNFFHHCIKIRASKQNIYSLQIAGNITHDSLVIQ